MPTAEEAFSSAEPRSTGSESQARTSKATSGVLVLKITPMGAFAAGALLVSALALAVAVGRQHPLNNGALNDPGKPAVEPRVSAKSLEDLRNSNPVRYESLQVDRGKAK